MADAFDQALDLLRQGVLSIDNCGRIWRHQVLSHGKWKPIEPRRAENVGNKGYLRLALWSERGKVRNIMAHRVVWYWLHGPIPDGQQINHKDLDKTNNHPENLELVTGSNNIRHSYANGRPRPYCRTDTTETRLGDTVRGLRKQGLTLQRIAAETGLSTSQVHRLCAKGGGG